MPCRTFRGVSSQPLAAAFATELGDLASDATEHPFDKIAERAKAKKDDDPYDDW